MRKHVKPSLFRRIFPKRTYWVDRVKMVQSLPIGYETDRRVLFMPRTTVPYELGNYNLN